MEHINYQEQIGKINIYEATLFFTLLITKTQTSNFFWHENKCDYSSLSPPSLFLEHDKGIKIPPFFTAKQSSEKGVQLNGNAYLFARLPSIFAI